MVLTVPVLIGAERARYSRRVVLGAALGGLVGSVGAATLAGCDKPGSDQVRKIADPLNPLYRDTAALLARYEATIAALPELAARLTPLRDAHREHLRALAREIGPNLDSSAPAASGSVAASAPADAGAALAALRDAEKAGSAAARAACLAGPSYRAGLLGSIAAARASHEQVLS
jgi:hypothetical protein